MKSARNSGAGLKARLQHEEMVARTGEHEANWDRMRRRIEEDSTSVSQRRKNPWDPVLYPTYVLRTEQQIQACLEEKKQRERQMRSRQVLQRQRQQPRGIVGAGVDRNGNRTMARDTRVTGNQHVSMTSAQRAQTEHGPPMKTEEMEYFQFKKFLAKNIVDNHIFKHSDLLVFFNEAMLVHPQLECGKMKQVIRDLCREIELYRSPTAEELEQIGTVDFTRHSIKKMAASHQHDTTPPNHDLTPHSSAPCTNENTLLSTATSSHQLTQTNEQFPVENVNTENENPVDQAAPQPEPSLEESIEELAHELDEDFDSFSDE
ncbi:hypothetical protein Pelo_6290 [Pelomyxa schiedti]|nr:hypothetical protein Pelo_6290 [Pelomyxa schiedti]